MESIIIYLSYKCNLNCKYCFVKKEDNIIDEIILKKILKWFLAQKGNIKKINFLGGEPLLHINLLEKVNDILKEINSKKKIKIKNIPTNGVLLNESIIKLLKKHNLKLDFSFDGEIDIQSENRTQDSIISKKIFDNIQLYKNLYELPEIKVTVSPDKTKRLYKDIMWLLDKGLTKISITPAFGQVWGEDKLKEFEYNYKKLVSFYFKNKDKDINIQPIQEDYKRIVSKQLIDNPNCGLGKELVFTPDGEAYACTLIMHVNNNKLKDKFRLGHISENINLKKMDDLKNYKICDDINLNCEYKFPVVSCKKICSCFDFKNKKLFSSKNALLMIKTENIMFLSLYDFIKKQDNINLNQSIKNDIYNQR